LCKANATSAKTWCDSTKRWAADGVLRNCRHHCLGTEALKKAMEEKSREFAEKGNEIYAKPFA
jgi:hypothetical protein